MYKLHTKYFEEQNEDVRHYIIWALGKQSETIIRDELG